MNASPAINDNALDPQIGTLSAAIRGVTAPTMWLE
jgi:hypothetical protein